MNEKKSFNLYIIHSAILEKDVSPGSKLSFDFSKTFFFSKSSRKKKPKEFSDFISLNTENLSGLVFLKRNLKKNVLEIKQIK